MRPLRKCKILALIPARGGSKTPPRKNLLLFRGRPLVVHSIEQALQAKHVDRVVVSTDSDEIAAISRRAGAEVPFLRPACCAGDYSTDLQVFQHALRWMDEHEKYRADLIVHLRPTSPLRPAGIIDRAVMKLLECPQADSLRTVIVAPHTPYKMWRLQGDYLQPLLSHPEYSEPYNMPRQLLSTVYWQNAYVDVTRWQTVIKKNSMTGDRILALVMSEEEDIDIDSRRDLDRAMDRLQT